MSAAEMRLTEIRFKVNGAERSVSVPPMKRLLDVLREDLELTGTKEGCGEGECGSCSVLLDGVLVNRCLVPALQANGCELLTVEGLAANGALAHIQRTFLELGGTQYGICTLGGNIANASPAADSPPVLLVYEAEIEQVSAQGARRMPYSEFHLGYKRTVMRPQELVKAVHLPRGRRLKVEYLRNIQPMCRALAWRRFGADF
jgi:xanthine dehydrogenase iron-sulfur cluster and FAD-binding subunit A